MKFFENKDPLTVIARSPFHVFYEGEAKSVSGENKVGPFDVLPGHADFFSMLKAGEIQIDTNEEPVSFPVTNGIIAVRDNEVMLFVNM